MKKILKKIGVIGLAIAVLTPFIELSNVNAASDDCETHLQNYMFLDETYAIDINSKAQDKGKGKCDSIGGCIFGQYIEADSTGSVPGYTTYALFPYKFSEINNNQYVKEVEVTFNDLSDDTSLNTYWQLHNTVLNYSSIATNLTMQDPNQYGKTFVSRENPNYKTDTILLHGKWKSTNSTNLAEISKWATSLNVESSVQSLGIVNTAEKEKMIVTIDGAVYHGNSFGDNTSVSWKSSPADYIKKMLNGENPNAIATEGEYRYIAFKVNRKLTPAALNGITFGYKKTDGDITTYYIYSKTSTNTVAGATNSYQAMKDHLEGGAFEENVFVLKDENEYNSLSFNNETSYYWPYVMNIEYTVCSNTTENWSINYDDNVNDTSVQNMPNPITQTEKVGTDIKLSTQKPTREGFTFKNWCINENGSGDCYNAGETVKSPEGAKTITLFAQWGDTKNVDNEKTGVISYVIGFAAVGLVAGGIYLVSKKKNLFKQI